MSNYNNISEFKKLRGQTGIDTETFYEGSVRAISRNEIHRRKDTSFGMRVGGSYPRPSSGLTWGTAIHILNSCLGKDIKVAIGKFINKFGHAGFKPENMDHFVTDIDWEVVELVKHGGGYNSGYFLNSENILCYLHHDGKVYKDKTFIDVQSKWKVENKEAVARRKQERLDKLPKTLGEKLSAKAKHRAEVKEWYASKEPNLETGQIILQKQSKLFKAKYTVALKDVLKDVE